MKPRSPFVLSLSAAALSFGLAFAPAAFAQGMKDSDMKKPDTMSKPDTMAKPAADTMKKDTMGKTDTMADPKKADGMAKDNMKK